jgi:hypothetical protein
MKNLFLFVFLLQTTFSFALDLWRYPETADKNTVFASILSPSVSLDGFALLAPVMTLDYITPFGLPVSLGFFITTPKPNLKSFGLRAAYHIDINNEFTDLYFLYVFDLGWMRNDLLIEYNDTPAEVRYYDFRAGVRRRFGNFFCLTIETDFKLRGLIFGLAVKFN